MNDKVILGLQLTRQQIEKAVCKVWDIPVKDLYKRTREVYISEPRFVIFYYRNAILEVAPSKIKQETGFSHSNILHAKKVIPNLLETDKLFRARYELFLKELETIGESRK